MIEASKSNEMLENFPLKCTSKCVLDLYFLTLIFLRAWDWESRMRMRVFMEKIDSRDEEWD